MTTSETGHSVAEAYGELRMYLEAQMRLRQAGRGTSFVRDGAAAASRALWKQQGAGDAMRWRRRFDDEESPALMKAAIRLDPFVIRRRDAR